MYSEIKATDAYGNAREVLQNNGIVATSNHFDTATGLLATSEVTSDNAIIQSNQYVYDSLGNMKTRVRSALPGQKAKVSYPVKVGSDIVIDVHLGKQSFGYDSLNRLTTVNDVEWLTYYDNGNIKSKLDVGYYCYDASRPHAVSGVNQSDCTGVSADNSFIYDDWGNMTSSDDRSIAYTDFDKAHTITKSDVTTTFAYDTARNRYERTDSDSDTRTLYFGAQERVYEKDSSDAWILKSIRRNLPGAIQTIDGSSGAESTHYQHKDNLGSVNTVTNENGRIVQKMYFDPWGKKFLIPNWMWGDAAQSMEARTLANILDITPRGFTGHEHVDQADIIHMNGRIYDPTLGRFLQADPHIQAPLNSQNYNRYSYVLNNPMSYTDPSGYFFKALGKFVKKYWRQIAAVALAVVTYGAASGWAASLGLTNTVSMTVLGTTQTFVTGLSLGGYAFAGAVTGFVSGAVATGSLKGALKGAFSGAVFGGLGYGQHVQGWSTGTQLAAHGLAGGIISDLDGGKFGHGFITAGIMKAVGKINVKGTISRTMIQAIAGGTVSRITGGKFANGAMTSALQYITNEASQIMRHPDAPLAKWLNSIGEEVKGAWNSLSTSVEAIFKGSGSVGVAGAVHYGVEGLSIEKGRVFSSDGESCSYLQRCTRVGPGLGVNTGGVANYSINEPITKGTTEVDGFFLEAGAFGVSYLNDGSAGYAHGKLGYGALFGAGYQMCTIEIEASTCN